MKIKYNKLADIEISIDYPPELVSCLEDWRAKKSCSSLNFCARSFVGGIVKLEGYIKELHLRLVNAKREVNYLKNQLKEREVVEEPLSDQNKELKRVLVRHLNMAMKKEKERIKGGKKQRLDFMSFCGGLKKIVVNFKFYRSVK